LEEGAMMATRLYTPEQFSMTAGVNVPFDLALIEESGGLARLDRSTA
jgi:hypothetical protein